MKLCRGGQGVKPRRGLPRGRSDHAARAQPRELVAAEAEPPAVDLLVVGARLRGPSASTPPGVRLSRGTMPTMRSSLPRGLVALTMFSRARMCGSSKRSRTLSTGDRRHLGASRRPSTSAASLPGHPRLDELVELGAARKPGRHRSGSRRGAPAVPWRRRRDARTSGHSCTRSRSSDRRAPGSGCGARRTRSPSRCARARSRSRAVDGDQLVEHPEHRLVERDVHHLPLAGAPGGAGARRGHRRRRCAPAR